MLFALNKNLAWIRERILAKRNEMKLFVGRSSYFKYGGGGEERGPPSWILCALSIVLNPQADIIRAQLPLQARVNLRVPGTFRVQHLCTKIIRQLIVPIGSSNHLSVLYRTRIFLRPGVRPTVSPDMTPVFLPLPSPPPLSTNMSNLIWIRDSRRGCLWPTLSLPQDFIRDTTKAMS